MNDTMLDLDEVPADMAERTEAHLLLLPTAFVDRFREQQRARQAAGLIERSVDDLMEFWIIGMADRQNLMTRNAPEKPI